MNRGRWNGWLYLVTTPLTLALFIVTVVGIALIPLTAGLLLVAVAIPITRWVAGVHRGEAERMLGEPVPTPYREPTTANWVGRMAQRGRDPQSWRDLLWLFEMSTIGFALAIVAVVVFLIIPFYLISPFLMWVTPDGTFDTNFGIINVDTVPESFLYWALAAVAVPLWWYGVPHLMRLQARIDRALLGPTGNAKVRMLQERVHQLAETRSEAVDVQAAELRRIERDLHDGAQARIVSSGMTLGLALQTLETDPESARALVKEAQATNRAALQDLRTVVRGIHPPMLAARGLVGGVEALAVQLPLPVKVTPDVNGRPPPAVETAVYFAVAECVTNIGKHAAASQASITLRHVDGALQVTIEDDGHGGAQADPGGGLEGIAHRLAVFDGTITVDSPAGGPTRIAMMVPCDLSSVKT